MNDINANPAKLIKANWLGSANPRGGARQQMNRSARPCHCEPSTFIKTQPRSTKMETASVDSYDHLTQSHRVAKHAKEEETRDQQIVEQFVTGTMGLALASCSQAFRRWRVRGCVTTQADCVFACRFDNMHLLSPRIEQHALNFDLKKMAVLILRALLVRGT